MQKILFLDIDVIYAQTIIQLLTVNGLAFPEKAIGEHRLNDDHQDRYDIGRIAQSDDECKNRDDDGKDQIASGVVQPGERHEVSSENHGIDH